MTNLILNTDSYKASHFLQYPPGTEHVSSYIESRGGDFESTLFFGLQAFIIEYLLKPIRYDDIFEAEAVLKAHGLPFNRSGWMRIVNTHGGHLPIEISAVPEGSVIPTGNVLVQVVNTDRDLPWLTSYIETALLRAVWYPTTIATLSFEAKRIIKSWMDKTSVTPGDLDFKLHDFGARGVSSHESAGLGGLAHLVNFKGTDTLAAILAARRFYQCTMAGQSIPAAEHSTMTSWERRGETDAYRNMLAQFAGPGKMVAVVSDSYDILNAVNEIWGKTLKDEVTACGGTVVIRPDSGKPDEIVPHVLLGLAEKFGSKTNRKGYRVLPDCVRVIQGDGMNLEAIDNVLRAIAHYGFSADNVAFGMGGGLLQKIDRDTMKWAMKTSAVKVNGFWRDVWKDPVTDPGKLSKRGILALALGDRSWQTVRVNALPQGAHNYLDPVYRDGQLLRTQGLDEIRACANVAL